MRNVEEMPEKSSFDLSRASEPIDIDEDIEIPLDWDIENEPFRSVLEERYGTVRFVKQMVEIDGVVAIETSYWECKEGKYWVQIASTVQDQLLQCANARSPERIRA